MPVSINGLYSRNRGLCVEKIAVTQPISKVLWHVNLLYVYICFPMRLGGKDPV